MKHTHNQCVENDQTRTLDARSCSFFRKIVYKYPFLQRSIEKWKIEARLCVTLVDLLFYASFSPVCLCLATISVSILRRVFSPLVFYFSNLFFFLFFIVSWNEWSNGVACLDVVVLFWRSICFHWIESNGRKIGENWISISQVYRFVRMMFYICFIDFGNFHE